MDLEKLVAHWPRENQENNCWQGKWNMSCIPSILIHVKLQSYKTSPVAADAWSWTWSSSPGHSRSGSDSRPPSQPHSRSHPAPPTLTSILQVVKQFRNAALTLDFTSASRSLADQSIEDEPLYDQLPPCKEVNRHGWVLDGSVSQSLIVNRTWTICRTTAK
jgi:hypothetical protein